MTEPQREPHRIKILARLRVLKARILQEQCSGCNTLSDKMRAASDEKHVDSAFLFYDGYYRIPSEDASKQSDVRDEWARKIVALERRYGLRG